MAAEFLCTFFTPRLESRTLALATLPYKKRKANARVLTCSTEVTVSTPSSKNISADCCSRKHHRGLGMLSMVVKGPL